MSLLNWGGGLSAAGSAISSFAEKAGVEQQKSDLEKQQAVLADQLATTRETTLAGVQGEQQRQTAVTTATAQGEQTRQTQEAANKLPLSPAQIAENKISQQKADAATTEANKPISGGFTGTFLVRNPSSGAWEVKNAAGSAPAIDKDPNSNNLTAQTGLSDLSIKILTGQTAGMRLGQGQSQAAENEITKWGIDNGINTSTMKSQAKAAQTVVERNVERNNQATILENEISGTIDSVAPIADAVGTGRLKMANVLAVWAGKEVNDKDAIQAADQLGRLRNELAGYNAVAGGNLSENGTPKPTPEDFRNAEATISNGISSGGLKALQQSVALSAAKNRNVLEKAIDDGNASFYKLFGATYHAPNRAADQPGSAPGGAPAAPAAPKTPTLPPGVPSGSQYSASRDQWRAPDGTLYNADGSKVAK